MRRYADQAVTVLLPAGAGQTVRIGAHAAALERAVLAAFTIRKPCRRKTNRPPSAEALALARRLAPQALIELDVPSLERIVLTINGRQHRPKPSPLKQKRAVGLLV